MKSQRCRRGGVLALGAALLAPSSVSAAPNASETAAPTDIIVTARRVPERLHDVPISVTAIDAGRLERSGTRRLEDVARQVPNLSQSPTGVQGVGQLTLRGIFSPVGAATVGLYVDDTPIQIRPLLFTGHPDPHIFDVERIEVLRGPQGTLFGASSLGGTIRFITRQPDFHSHDGQASAEIAATKGGDLSHELSAIGGAPLAEGLLALRAGAYLRRDGGYVDKVDAASGALLRRNIDDVTTLALRAALSARAGDAVTITPLLFYQSSRSDDLPVFESTRGAHRQAFINDQPGKDALLLASLTVNADLGAATLTSVSSFFRREDKGETDYSTVFGELVLGGAIPGLVPEDGTRSLRNIRQGNLTQEIRLASSDGEAPVRWVLGAFFQRSEVRLGQLVVEPGITSLVEELFGLGVEELFGAPLLPGGATYRGDERLDDTQLAGFGELSWRFAPTLEAVAGLRVTRSMLALEVASEGPYAGPDSSANRVRERRTETPLTPRLGLSYRPTELLLLYASASRGFRAGGANTPVPADPCGADLRAFGRSGSPPSYGSDSLWSYEVGAKATGQSLDLSAAIFHVDWSDVQQQVALPTCGFSFVDNLGQARSRGFEVEARIRPIAGFELALALGHTDSEFRDTLVGGEVPDTGERAVLVRRGERIPFTPKWTAAIAAEYRWALTRSMQAYARADYQYAGPYRRTPAPPSAGYNEAVFAAPAQSEAALRLGVEHGPWSAAAFVENLFNRRAIRFSSAELVAATRRPLRQSTRRPRSVGVRISKRF